MTSDRSDRNRSDIASAQPVIVRDVPERGRFEIRVGDQLAGFAQYRLGAGQITLFHTEIMPRYEGRGLGSTLAREALTDIQRRRLPLVPVCPFIASYLREHAGDYSDLNIRWPTNRSGDTT